MSMALRAMLGVAAHHGGGLIDDAYEVCLGAIASEAGQPEVLLVPSQVGVVESINIVGNTRGFPGAEWVSSIGAMSRKAAEGGGPPETGMDSWIRQEATAPATLPLCWVISEASPVTQLTAWFYVYIRAPYGRWSVRVQNEAGSVDFTQYHGESVTDGWVLVAGNCGLTAGEKRRIRVQSRDNLTTGQYIEVTGATIVAGYDSGMAFDGYSAKNAERYYRWESAAGASRSYAHGRRLDLIGLREAEAGYDVAPTGLTVEQRRLFLIHDNRSRDDSSAKGLVDLIVAAVQTEEPTFTAAGVRIIRDYVNRQFTVAINYSPTGALAARIDRLIKDHKPSAIALTGVTFGGTWNYLVLSGAYASYAAVLAGPFANYEELLENT